MKFERGMYDTVCFATVAKQSISSDLILITVVHNSEFNVIRCHIELQRRIVCVIYRVQKLRESSKIESFLHGRRNSLIGVYIPLYCDLLRQTTP